MKNDKMLDPDARFILANERTLLAWIRTSLTVIAGGVAFAHFSDDNATTRIVSLLVLLLGGSMTPTMPSGTDFCPRWV
jgi:putative membrane protein